MDMIKKIALTASTMLFVLAQVFSFYVIYVSRQEKIDLLKAEEEKIFRRGISDMGAALRKVSYEEAMQDHVITYYFRINMPENSALYKGKAELHNSTSFVQRIKYTAPRHRKSRICFFMWWIFLIYTGRVFILQFGKYWFRFWHLLPWHGCWYF